MHSQYISQIYNLQHLTINIRTLPIEKASFQAISFHKNDPFRKDAFLCYSSKKFFLGYISHEIIICNKNLFIIQINKNAYIYNFITEFAIRFSLPT